MNHFSQSDFATARVSPLASTFSSTRFAQHSRVSNTRVQTRYAAHSQPVAAPVVDQAVDLLPRDISSRFGRRLRELRHMHNMTQLRMAVDFGIDRSFISDVERGKKSISLHMLEVIALGMKVSLSDLLSGM